MRRRVVVTGIGCVSPVGLSVKETWAGLIAGVAGIGPISLFDATDLPCTIAGEATGFDPEPIISAKDARKMDRFIQLGLVASVEAFADSGIVVSDSLAPRFGVAVGAGIGGLRTIEDTTALYSTRGHRRVSPFYIPGSIINMISGNVSIRLGLKGPNIAIATACSTGTHSIGQAARMIQYGDADAMLAGGAEAGVTPTAVAGFSMARALTRHNAVPREASRPWDVDRDGFVIGEGAGVVLLEEFEHARQRGARIYAELAGFGLNADANHMTQPLPDGDGAAQCMVNAVRDAGVSAESISYINAHGTSTPLGDIAETKAIKLAFGDHAYDMMISSNKSMIGHLLGAAGGVEAISTILSVHHQLIPPTINLDSQDPECDLDYVPHTARDVSIEAAISNSFGFGGTNGSLVFRRLQ
ncbi:MAG: beta-ketoacyl-ACP synthase II [Arenicellales bacterium]|nr:beta-ketoacyl-ACP synthase II [Arenicellales bacterium]